MQTILLGRQVAEPRRSEAATLGAFAPSRKRQACRRFGPSLAKKDSSQSSPKPDTSMRVPSSRIMPGFSAPGGPKRISFKSCLLPCVAEPVQGHRHHDDDADEDLLHVVWPAHLLAAVAEEGHGEGPDHGAEDAALPAAQAASADDDRSDHVQLGTDGHRGSALAQA